MLIINADDWGRSPDETDAALDCFRAGRITSTTAMVFMEDSERAAELALKAGINVGLHLNLNERFNANDVPPAIAADQGHIVDFLRRGRYAQLIYHPLLKTHFRATYHAQATEFERLYGRPPSHVDGHQHMHLCSNMLWDGVIPKGLRIRRSFSFSPGEKSYLNRAYRRLVDWRVTRRYRTTDYFFALSQNLEPRRLQHIMELSRHQDAELMTHPVLPPERSFLKSAEFGNMLGGIQTASYRGLK